MSKKFAVLPSRGNPAAFARLTQSRGRIGIHELNSPRTFAGDEAQQGATFARWTNPGNLNRWIIWLSFAATVAIAIWSSGRGFDFLDTGCYFLEYKFPADVADTHTTYHLFARPFFLLVNQSVVGFRYVSWIFIWISALAFAWGFWRYINALYARREQAFSLSLVFGMMLLASAANYTIKPAALTYNSLNFVGLGFALGLFWDGLTRLSAAQNGGGWGVGEIVSAALAATIDILIKPTTAVFLLGVFSLYCALSPAIALRYKKQLAVIAAAATGVAVSGMVLFVGGWKAFLIRIQTLVDLAADRRYMGELYARVGKEFSELSRFLLHDLRYALAAAVLASIVLFVLRSKTLIFRRAAAVAGAVIFGLWLYSTISGKLWRGSHNLYFEGIVARLYLGAAVLALVAASLSKLVVPKEETAPYSKGNGWMKFFLVFVLIFTPFAGAFGTTTSIYLNGALYAVCWLGALLIAFLELEKVWQTSGLIPWATIPFALYAVAQLFHGQIYSPYMYPVPLWEHRIPTAIGNDHSMVLMDAADNQLIDQTRRILESHGFKSGDDIFCFFNIPGLVYAVGGRSPVIPWYFGRIYGGNTVEEIFMQTAGAERRRHAWLFTQADVLPFRDHFHRGGINFPEGYEEIGSLVNPQSGLPVKIWKPLPSKS